MQSQYQFARRDIGVENGNGNIEERKELGDGERFGDLECRSVGDTSPLSPLPPVARRPGDAEGEREGLGIRVVGFSRVLRGPVKKLQGEEVKEMVYELA
jgi:hypothetical protein